SYIESQVVDKTSLVKTVHTIVTKLLFVILSMEVNINSVRHNSCQPSSVIEVSAEGGTTARKPMVWRF
ncbi:MAG: hypothetical protein ACE5H0_09515, partial [Bacteroidota bacterium]